MPWFLGNSHSFLSYPRGFWGWNFGIPFFIVWSLAWGGLALWHSAKRNEKWWFIAFLFIHTAGILEIIYLVFVVKLFSSDPQTTTVTRKTKKGR